jgi:hypothetical protein
LSRPALEVADIFRAHGAAWCKANAGHASLGQLKVMSAIESCRTAALGGHVARCEKCSHTLIAYNSCRNRHCPKCQGAAAKEWLAARETDPLASMSMLRWPHDHHRDLRTRLNTSISANAANRDHDRLVMITIPAPQIQNTDRSRWSLIRRRGARSNACFRSQLAHRTSSLDADTHVGSNPLTVGNNLLTRRNAVDQCARSRSRPSRTSSAELKSP